MNTFIPRQLAPAVAVLLALIHDGGATGQTRQAFESTISSAPATAWLEWGGPRRNFTSDAVGLADAWPESGPPRAWTRELGDGHSSILVDAGRLYTMYRPLTNENGRWSDEEVVIALDAPTGRTIWEHRYPSSLQGMDLQYGPGPHSTPLIVGERLFTTGTNKQIFALDKTTGAVAWSHDLVKEFNAPPHYVNMSQKPGYHCSPVAYKNMIFVTAGGPGQAVIAFRQDDGALVWRSGEFAIAPASPLVITVQGQDQLIIFASDRVVGLNPDTGAVLWSHPHPRRQDVNVTTPVWSPEDNLLLVSSAQDSGTRVLELSRAGVKELWYTNKVRVYFTTVIRIGDYYYGSSGEYGPIFFTAIHARTGEIALQDRSLARSSFLYADGKLIILDEDGTLALATASPQQLKVLAKTPLLNAKAWTVPTLAGTKLYVRDRATIAALELGRGPL